MSGDAPRGGRPGSRGEWQRTAMLAAGGLLTVGMGVLLGRKAFSKKRAASSACGNCVCESGPSPPGVEPRATLSKLLGSCKFYERHLFVASSMGHALWSKRLENADSLFKKMQKSAKSAPQRTKVGYIDFTDPRCHCPWKLDVNDVLAFPDNKVYRNIDSEEKISALLMSDMVDSSKGNGIIADDSAAPTPGDSPVSHGQPAEKMLLCDLDCEDIPGRCILVCGHIERDSRCGHFGLEATKIMKDLDGPDAIFLTSHVGGHVYAPNILIFPPGDWYGLVPPDQIKQLVVRDDIDFKYWRGRMGIPPEEAKLMATVTKK